MFWKKKNKPTELDGNAPMHAMHLPEDIKVVIKTDLGNVRNNNEDAASFFRMTDAQLLLEKGFLLLVADGMGGHQAGEVASRMAIDIISETYFKRSSEKNKEKILLQAFQSANNKIFEQASSNELQQGMGTTCTAIVIDTGAVYFAHAGDSRAYLYKDKIISRLTEDHTYVQQLVNNGDISMAQAAIHPERNVLTNAMGTKPTLRVDTGKCKLSFDKNDVIMLCTDGLYDYLTDDEIAAALETDNLQTAADYFISEAKRRGGKDNITVLLAAYLQEKQSNNVRSTRMVTIPKATRDAELPPA